ncbi:MAG: hypothetical protein HY698_14190 [Deltaproteobacteria bacterium]|nr:hypothetical protein [Deltaproteobacteria bacterium]
MSHGVRSALVLVMLSVVLLVSSCGGPRSARVKDEWPGSAESYADASRRFTRHGTIQREADQVLDVHATLKSGDFRAAMVAEMARRARLDQAAHAELEAREREAEQRSFEVELLAATYHYAWNDFAREQRSIWRVTLVGEDGREVTPLSVKEDRRPRGEIATWYRDLSPFHRAYVVVFPKAAPDGTPLLGASSRLKLKIGSSLGAVELTWGP